MSSRNVYTALSPDAATFAPHAAFRPDSPGPSAPESRPKTWPASVNAVVQNNTGLLLVASAQGFFSAVNVAVKKLNTVDPPVPPLELVMVRMGITYVCCIGYMLWAKVPDPFLGPKGVRVLLFIRGLVGFFGLFGIYYSLQYLSLSDATVLTFLAPLTTAIAGALILKESYSMREAAASLVSLVGVVLIARPPIIFGANPDTTERGTPSQRLGAVGVALIGVLGATGAYISIRAIGKRAHPLHALGMFSMHCVLVSIVGMGLLKISIVIPRKIEFLGLLLLIGICGFIAQVLLTLGLQRETAGRGIIAVYVQIIFATIFERIFFRTVPSLLSILGTIIIMSSAIYVALTKANPQAKAASQDAALEEGLLNNHDTLEQEEDEEEDRNVGVEKGEVKM